MYIQHGTSMISDAITALLDILDSDMGDIEKVRLQVRAIAAFAEDWFPEGDRWFPILCKSITHMLVPSACNGAELAAAHAMLHEAAKTNKMACCLLTFKSGQALCKTARESLGREKNDESTKVQLEGLSTAVTTQSQ